MEFWVTEPAFGPGVKYSHSHLETTNHAEHRKLPSIILGAHLEPQDKV